MQRLNFITQLKLLIADSLILSYGTNALRALKFIGFNFTHLSKHSLTDIIESHGSNVLNTLKEGGVNFAQFNESELTHFVLHLGADAITPLAQAGFDFDTLSTDHIGKIIRKLGSPALPPLQKAGINVCSTISPYFTNYHAYKINDLFQLFEGAECSQIRDLIEKTILDALGQHDFKKAESWYDQYHHQLTSSALTRFLAQEGHFGEKIAAIPMTPYFSTSSYQVTGNKSAGVNDGNIYEDASGESYLVKSVYYRDITPTIAIIGATIARTVLGEENAALDQLIYHHGQVYIMSRIIPHFQTASNSAIDQDIQVEYERGHFCALPPTFDGRDGGNLVNWIVKHGDLNRGNYGLVTTNTTQSPHIAIIDFDLARFPTTRNAIPICNKEQFFTYAQKWLDVDIPHLMDATLQHLAVFSPLYLYPLPEIERSLLSSQELLRSIIESDCAHDCDFFE